MKTTNHIAKWIQAYFMLLFCISTVIFTACNEDKLNLDQEIYGLGGNDEQKNELDKWLYENYTQAYNIEVKYKWNSYELNTTAQLVPIMERFVKPSMDMIQRVWFEPYKQLAGDKFLREMTPKKIILVGSPEYNADWDRLKALVKLRYLMVIATIRVMQTGYVLSCIPLNTNSPIFSIKPKCMIPVSKIYPPEIIIRQGGLLKRK